MAGRKRAALVAALAIVLGIVSFEALRLREPSYQGKSLTKWLAIIDEDTDEISEELYHAVQQMGTNAVPHLLKLLQRRPSPTRERFYKLVNFVFRTELSDDTEVFLAYRRGLAGFQALGPRAKVAIPELISLLEDGDGLPVIEALGYLGADASAPLMGCLESKNPETRSRAVDALNTLGTNAEPAIPLLLERLKDSSESRGVRLGCVITLAQLGRQPEHVVPALAASLSDRNLMVPAMHGLFLFGTNATAAIPALLPLLNDPDTNVAGVAQRVLAEIDRRNWTPPE
jgi:hypothetical protein